MALGIDCAFTRALGSISADAAGVRRIVNIESRLERSSPTHISPR
jgi:hypothetical protein